MRSLFADKLSGQSEARQQDKKRADSIHFEPGDTNLETSGRPPSFAPTAGPRTLTEARPSRGRAAVVATALAAIVGLVLGSGAALSFAARARAPKRQAIAVVAPPAPILEPAVVPSTHGHGAIAVSSTPAGATLFVNGELSAETTPATFANVAIGAPYTITVAAKGFEDTSQSVTLTEDNPGNAISVVLRHRAKPRHR